MNQNRERPPLIIRADADSRIGVGHVMRCLALAQGWRRQGGGRIVFCGRIEGEGLRNRLSAEGFTHIDVPAPHPHPNDLALVLSHVDEQRHASRGWIVLDGYHFTPEYQEAIRKTKWRVLVIDDMAHHSFYHADAVLNQNIQAGGLAYRTGPETILLLGSRYILLRDEFLFQRPTEKKILPRAENILITMGGADPDNATLAAIEALTATGQSGLSLRVVIGPANPHGKTVEEALRGSPFHWETVMAADDMPAHMAWADLAISAAGSTCWELAYMGIPFATAVLAENQEGIAEALSETGAAVSLGEIRQWAANGPGDILAEIIRDEVLRKTLSNKAAALVDGRGSDRAARAMLFFDFNLRMAGPDDCETIFRWANDPAVRGASFHTEPIAWEDHQRWFAAQLIDPCSVFYIAVAPSGVPLGQIRFNLSGAIAVISVSVDREARGCGIGGRLIREACKRLTREKIVSQVRAFIRAENHASEKSFYRAGFSKKADALHEGVPAVEMAWGGKDCHAQ